MAVNGNPHYAMVIEGTIRMTKKKAEFDQFQIRLPPGMRERIREVAEANNRSMNAEIVATLEDAYGVEGERVVHTQLPALEFKVDDLINRVNRLASLVKNKDGSGAD